ncbi:hypothetical protein [Vermiculatibacterium agrestimuris]|uniref:hypothetical protein n=1 Tax=Vermiculatibacterium agrestimuris TaxID=2941519 RepID=UPI002041FA53|nr:hypothetical protein [Vermiculatibacterium agrestimuris]
MFIEDPVERGVKQAFRKSFDGGLMFREAQPFERSEFAHLEEYQTLGAKYRASLAALKGDGRHRYYGYPGYPRYPGRQVKGKNSGRLEATSRRPFFRRGEFFRPRFTTRWKSSIIRNADFQEKSSPNGNYRADYNKTYHKME